MKDLRAILDRLFPEGGAQSAAARFLEIDARTLRRYVAGEQDVPPPTAKFLRYLDAAGIDPAAVDAAIAGKAKRPRKAKP